MTLKTINFRNKININSGQEREVKIMIILLSIFMSGIILGISLLINNNDLFVNIFNNLFNKENTFFSVFINSLILNLFLLILIFISGFSSIGIPLIVITLFFKGITIGIISAVLVFESGLSGLGIYLLSVFPSNIIYAVTLLLSSDYSIIQSVDILRLINGNSINNKIEMRKYIRKNIVFSFLISAASLSDGLLIISFGNLFFN